MSEEKTCARCGKKLPLFEYDEFELCERCVEIAKKELK